MCLGGGETAVRPSLHPLYARYESYSSSFSSRLSKIEFTSLRAPLHAPLTISSRLRARIAAPQCFTFNTQLLSIVHKPSRRQRWRAVTCLPSRSSGRGTPVRKSSRHRPRRTTATAIPPKACQLCGRSCTCTVQVQAPVHRPRTSSLSVARKGRASGSPLMLIHTPWPRPGRPTLSSGQLWRANPRRTQQRACDQVFPRVPVHATTYEQRDSINCNTFIWMNSNTTSSVRMHKLQVRPPGSEKKRGYRTAAKLGSREADLFQVRGVSPGTHAAKYGVREDE